MRKIMKRVVLVAVFSMLILSLSGCNDGTKNRIKTGEERAIEAKKDAEEVVDQVNEKVEQINQDVNKIEEE